MDERHDARIQLLRAYIWEHGPVTRREIALALSINLPAISKITAELLDDRQLVAAGQEDSTGGRKAWQLDIPADEGSVVALSFSSLGIASALSDMKARLSHRQSEPFELSAAADGLSAPPDRRARAAQVSTAAVVMTKAKDQRRPVASSEKRGSIRKG